MKKILNGFLFIFIIVALKTNQMYSRSYYRTPNNEIGHITVKYENDDNENNRYDLYESHLKEFPIFKTFDPDYFANKTLGKNGIFFNDDHTKSISTEKINSLIESLLKEISQKKVNFKDFKPLKKKNFSFKNGSGLIVLKFKNYPLILKLYIETPKDFTSPHSFSFQEDGIFYMGGALRHTTGWTRIKNAEVVGIQIKKDSYWSRRVVIPRKWFWMPKNPKWLEIKAYNLGDKKEQEIKVPAIYGVICDEIKGKDNEKSQYTKEFLKLCNFLEFQIDPHPNNFKLDENLKIALIDTEHYPTMTGQTEKMHYCKSHVSHYCRLAKKYVWSRWGRSKKERINDQRNTKTYYPLLKISS